jgi:hypothetical protein
MPLNPDIKPLVPTFAPVVHLVPSEEIVTQVITVLRLLFIFINYSHFHIIG